MNAGDLASWLLRHGWIVSLPRDHSAVLVDCGTRRLRVVPTATDRYAVTGAPAPRIEVVMDLEGVIRLLRLVRRNAEEPPRGWVGLSPLPSHLAAACQRCTAPAVAILPSGPRCVTHPPQRGEWGWDVDWTDPAHARGSAA